MSRNVERNNYLYGELNTKVKLNIYTGADTPTASVIVDNANNRIYVNAKIDVKLIEQYMLEVEQDFLQFLKDKVLIQSSIDNLKLDVNKLSDKSEIMNLRLDLLSIDLLALDIKVTNEIETKIAEVKEDISTLKKEIEEEIQQKLITLATKIDELRVELITAKQELHEEILSKCEDIVNLIQNTKSELEAKINSLGFTVVDGMLCAVFEGEENK